MLICICLIVWVLIGIVCLILDWTLILDLHPCDLVMICFTGIALGPFAFGVLLWDIYKPSLCSNKILIHRRKGRSL
jgi:hypothetical protein